LSGAGVATADGIYATFAAFGLSALSTLLISVQTSVRLIGGLFLLYLGIRTFFLRPADHAATAASRGGIGDYVSALALTITNPITILSFATIFAGAGLSSDAACAPLIVAGVFIGSMMWWFTLTTAVVVLRGRFTPTIMLWINRASGVIILAFALVTLIGLFFA